MAGSRDTLAMLWAERIYGFTAINIFFLYIVLVIVLLKYRNTELKGSFYALFTFCGFSDISKAFLWFFGYDLARWGILTSVYLGRIGQAIAAPIGMMCGYGIQVSRWVNVLMGLNRLSAMKDPMSYVIVWDSKMVKKSIIGTVIVSFVLNIHYWSVWGYYGTSYRRMGNTSTLVMLMDNPSRIAYRFWLLTSGVQSVSIIPIISVIYGIAFYYVHKQFSKNKVAPGTTATVNAQDANDRALKFKTEFYLMMVNFILALIQLSFAINMGLAFYSPEIFLLGDPYFYHFRFTVFYQMDSLMNPVLLLAMSKTTRECFIKFLKRQN